MTPEQKRKKALEIEKREKALEIEAQESSSLMETVQDVGLPLLQGATYNFADEIYGGAVAAGKKMKGAKEPFLDLLRQEAEPFRKAYKESLERSPKKAFAAEMLGGMVSPASKIGKGATIGKGVLSSIGEGVLSGIGSSESEIDSMDTAKQAAISGGLAGATSLITRGVSKIIPRDANVKRATVMGASAKDLQESGVKERAKIAEKLDDRGFFGAADRDFDVNTLKHNKNIGVESAISPASDPNIPVAGKLKDRAEDAIGKIQEAKENIWPAVKNRTIPENEVDDLLSRAVGEYTEGNPRYEKALEAASSLKEEFMQTLRLRGQERAAREGVPYQGITLKDLDELKSQMYDYTRFGKSLSDLPDSDVMYQKFARNLKEKVNDEVGNPLFSKLNEAQSEYLTVRGDLIRKQATQDTSQRRNLWDKMGVFLGDTLAGDEAALAGATLREGLEKVPYPLRRGAESAFERSPGVLYRQGLAEGEIPMPNRSPQGVMDEVPPTEIEWGAGVNMGEQDAVQKVQETLAPPQPEFNPYINEEILNTPLPRDSERVIKTPEVLKAKVAQMAPQFQATVDDLLGYDPEGVKEALPKIAEMMPHLFERDKYGMFDGKILNPEMQQKFLSDLSADEGMSSIEKAKLALKIKRGERI
jgi:hypothetical protein